MADPELVGKDSERMTHHRSFAYHLRMDVKLICCHQVLGVGWGVVCLPLVLSSTQGVKDRGFIIIATALSLSGEQGHCSGFTTKVWAFCTHLIAFL